MPAAAPSSTSVNVPSPGEAVRWCGGTNAGGGNGGPDKLGSGSAGGGVVGGASGGAAAADEEGVAEAMGTAVCTGVTTLGRGGADVPSKPAGARGPQAPKTAAQNPQVYHRFMRGRALARQRHPCTSANAPWTFPHCTKIAEDEIFHHRANAWASHRPSAAFI